MPGSTVKVNTPCSCGTPTWMVSVAVTVLLLMTTVAGEVAVESENAAALAEWNVAVMVCEPRARLVVEYVKVPLPDGVVNSVVAPSLNSTVPVAAAGLTVAVTVTLVPGATVWEAGDSVVVVGCTTGPDP